MSDPTTPKLDFIREIIAELQPQPQDIVFQKRRPDGFVGTDLDLILRSNGRPASMSVANCRVMTTSCLMETPPR